jgi:hypothetical protein
MRRTARGAGSDEMRRRVSEFIFCNSRRKQTSEAVRECRFPAGMLPWHGPATRAPSRDWRPWWDWLDPRSWWRWARGAQAGWPWPPSPASQPWVMHNESHLTPLLPREVSNLHMRATYSPGHSFGAVAVLEGRLDRPQRSWNAPPAIIVGTAGQQIMWE